MLILPSLLSALPQPHDPSSEERDPDRGDNIGRAEHTVPPESVFAMLSSPVKSSGPIDYVKLLLPYIKTTYGEVGALGPESGPA